MGQDIARLGVSHHTKLLWSCARFGDVADRHARSSRRGARASPDDRLWSAKLIEMRAHLPTDATGKVPRCRLQRDGRAHLRSVDRHPAQSRTKRAQVARVGCCQHHRVSWFVPNENVDARVVNGDPIADLSVADSGEFVRSCILVVHHRRAVRRPTSGRHRRRQVGGLHAQRGRVSLRESPGGGPCRRSSSLESSGQLDD